MRRIRLAAESAACDPLHAELFHRYEIVVQRLTAVLHLDIAVRILLLQRVAQFARPLLGHVATIVNRNQRRVPVHHLLGALDRHVLRAVAEDFELVVKHAHDVAGMDSRLS